jgi:hypothetical protein
LSSRSVTNSSIACRRSGSARYVAVVGEKESAESRVASKARGAVLEDALVVHTELRQHRAERLSVFRIGDLRHRGERGLEHEGAELREAPDEEIAEVVLPIRSHERGDQ